MLFGRIKFSLPAQNRSIMANCLHINLKFSDIQIYLLFNFSCITTINSRSSMRNGTYFTSTALYNVGTAEYHGLLVKWTFFIKLIANFSVYKSRQNQSIVIIVNWLLGVSDAMSGTLKVLMLPFQSAVEQSNWNMLTVWYKVFLFRYDSI